MGKQGGQGKGKPKKNDQHFGRALIRMQQIGAQGRYGARVAKPQGIDSILENTHLDDFIATTEMEGEEFEVYRPGKDDMKIIENKEIDKTQQMQLDNFDFSQLAFPKKPIWNASMTAEDVDRNEKTAFLEWRRTLAQVESAHDFGVKVTPFEKNLDVWRQLWRVCERSNLLIQVVDARNPLLYFTKDLVEYVGSMNPPRRMLIVLNKSDLLTEFQRSCWAEYFTAQGTPFVFYSARREETRLNNKETDLSPVFSPADFPDEEALAGQLLEMWSNASTARAPQPADAPDGESEVVWGGDEGTTAADKIADDMPSFTRTKDEACKVLSREGMLYVLHALARVLPTHNLRANSNRFCIGMIGFPNVGKSSLINTLLGVSKSSHGTVRVGVSSTPGKTKHFQTLVLSDFILLCDCPGLVFPSIMSSTAEMLCSGVLPINQMLEHAGAAAVILSRVPAQWLEALYGLQIVRQLDALDSPTRPPTPTEMLSAYCKVKTYVTSGPGGRWDEFRACKEILKDFTDGRLIYVCIPPHLVSKEKGVDSAFSQRWLRESESIMTQHERMAERLVINKLKQIDLAEASDASLSQGQEEGIVFPETYEFVDDDAALETAQTAQDEEMVYGAGGKLKRDHKRMKTWGKKGRKLREKNPYGSEDPSQTSYVAHTTNRQRSACGLIKNQA